jgi:hypothetical protein
MKTRIILLISCAAVLLTGCSRPPDFYVKRALHDVLAPEATPRQTRSTLASMADSPDLEPVLAVLGTNNFSMFFLAIELDSPLFATDYFEWHCPSPDIGLLGQQFERHLTAVAVGDIKVLTFVRTSNVTGTGSFSVDTAYGLRAEFLFVSEGDGDKLRVTQLAVKRKDSNEIADGVIVVRRGQEAEQPAQELSAAAARQPKP